MKNILKKCVRKLTAWAWRHEISVSNCNDNVVADKARLDWIDSNGGSLVKLMATFQFPEQWEIDSPASTKVITAATVRDAIDTARKQPL